MLSLALSFFPYNLRHCHQFGFVVLVTSQFHEIIRSLLHLFAKCRQTITFHRRSTFFHLCNLVCCYSRFFILFIWLCLQFPYQPFYFCKVYIDILWTELCISLPKFQIFMNLSFQCGLSLLRNNAGQKTEATPDIRKMPLMFHFSSKKL